MIQLKGYEVCIALVELMEILRAHHIKNMLSLKEQCLNGQALAYLDASFPYLPVSGKRHLDTVVKRGVWRAAAVQPGHCLCWAWGTKAAVATTAAYHVVAIDMARVGTASSHRMAAPGLELCYYTSQ